MNARRRPLPPDVAVLERQIELINRFPDQNPNPVMRMTDDGVLIYGNAASRSIRSTWGASVGEPLPSEVLAALRDAAAAGGGATVPVHARSARLQCCRSRFPTSGS